MFADTRKDRPMDIRGNYYIPFVIEQTDSGERSYDIF